MITAELPQLHERQLGLRAAIECTHAAESDAMAEHCPPLAAHIRQFKSRLAALDAHLLLHPEDAAGVADMVTQGLRSMVLQLNQTIGDSGTVPHALRSTLGRQAQHELLPYVLLTATAERFYSKPQGYAGDAETIARIYAQYAGGHGRVGPLVDQAFMDRSAAKAVRNRRHLLAGIIEGVVAEQAGQPTHITSLACGPAQEVFDLFQQPETMQQVQVQLVDIDAKALASVQARSTELGLQGQLHTHRANLLLLAARKRKLAIAPQHLMYSIGLIDYFDDARVVQLINWAYDHLAPGGALVLGNFHPSNPDKALMDHVLEWKLIHRDEADMHRLFSLSKFGRSADRIVFEDEGVNLFATAIKG
jgi:extracellular factor (EF) 3-hydroxypalmitic acid methyl ester biosynthesis protein